MQSNARTKIKAPVPCNLSNMTASMAKDHWGRRTPENAPRIKKRQGFGASFERVASG